MFNKLKAKAGQPLTYGWLWKCYAYEAIAALIMCGCMNLYEAYQDKKIEEADTAEDITVDYNESED